MKIPQRLIILALLANFAAPAARAQTFLQPEGQARIIANPIVSTSDHGFDDSGNATPIDTYDQVEVYVNGEYGLTRDVTLLLGTSYRDVSIANSDKTSGLDYTDLGARVRLAQGDGFVVSGQVLAYIPGSKYHSNIAQLGDTDAQYDLRLGAAKSFRIAGLDSFFYVEGAYRFRNGEPPNEMHVDATFGLHPAPRLLLLASSYNTISDGPGTGVFAYDYRYDDVYLSGVYDLTKALSLQLGLHGTMAGRNALRQRGFFTGLWVNF